MTASERVDLEGENQPHDGVRERIADAGQHPHFSRWAADPARYAPEPQSFGQVLDWLLDGLATLVPAPSGPPA